MATLSTDVQGSRRAPHSPPRARQASWSPTIGTRFLSQRSPVEGASSSGCSPAFGVVEGVYPAKEGGRTPAVQGHLPLSVAPSGASEKPSPSCHQIQALLPHRQGPPGQCGSHGWTSSEKILANSFCPREGSRKSGRKEGSACIPTVPGVLPRRESCSHGTDPQGAARAPHSAEPGVGWGGGLGPRPLALLGTRRPGLGATPSSPAHLGPCRLSRARPLGG